MCVRGGGHSLNKGIRGYTYRYGYVFTSSGSYYGHKFKILRIVLGYHLPVVCICYGYKMKMNGILGSEFKPACNEVNIAWFPGCIKTNTR